MIYNRKMRVSIKSIIFLIVNIMFAIRSFSLCFSLSALDEMADVVEHHQLLLKIEKAFPECDEEGCLKIYENVLRCVGNKRYVCQHLIFCCYRNVTYVS